MMCITGELIRTHHALPHRRGIRAWREWLVHTVYPDFGPRVLRLGPVCVNNPNPWRPSFLQGNWVVVADSTPTEENDNGIHANKFFHRGFGGHKYYSNTLPNLGFVVGTVRLFGDVVEYTNGFRAQFAVIEKVQATDSRMAELLRQSYGGFVCPFKVYAPRLKYFLMS